MAIDDRDDGFNSLVNFLQTIDDSTSTIKGHFKVSLKSDPSSFALYTISGLIDLAGWFRVQCANVAQSTVNFADGADVIITFARTGDIGPDGPQGIQGFTGIQGGPGLQGDGGGIGIQGTQGLQGVQGFQGLSGFIGGDGTQGFQGTQGIQSVQGIAGSDGDGGIQGFQGTQGLLGEGTQGLQGDFGSQGFAGIGATGIQGFQGIQGVSEAGTQGVQGDTGPIGFGLQGTQGAQGFQGTDGDLGVQGVQGLGGQGTSGLQGIQGLDGDTGPDGLQGTDGDGFQGVQGFQGAVGIGGTGAQGIGGFQGLQGRFGPPGDGGLQGADGIQGPQGVQGIDGGQGELGLQGVQGIIGDIGIQGGLGEGLQGMQGHQGTQGDLGVQGFPGQGTQGVQGTQAAQGIQGERGFQGTQGAQGFGPEGAVTNIQNVHETSVQDTALFLTMVEGGNTTQPLRATTGPNPGGESNFFYTSDADELTVENIQVEGNLTVVGSLTASGIEGMTDPIFLPSDVKLKLGFSTAAPAVTLEHSSAQGNFELRVDATKANQLKFVNNTAGTDEFTFDMVAGHFVAGGDVQSNSDERLKENVETIDNALDKVAALRGVYFDLIAKPGKRKLGLIAQEVEKVLPEVVNTSEEGDNIKSVAYANVVGLLIEAIKEIKGEVDQLKSQ